MMKRFVFFRGLCILSAAFLLSGCGDPDADFKAKVPTSAQAVVYLDGASLIRNKAVEKEIPENLDEELSVFSLKKDDFAGRFLFFGSMDEKWGGAVVQTKDGAAVRLFDAIVKGLKKKNEKFAESVSGKQRRLSFDNAIIVLYHENLLLCSVEKKQFEFYDVPGKNPLLSDLNFKNMLSGAMKVTLPQEKEVSTLTQMIPALKKLTTITLNAPVSDGPFTLEVSFLFSDEQSPAEALAALNMGLGMLARQNEEILKHVDRKTKGNALLVNLDSAFFTDAAEIGRKAREQARQSASLSNLKQIALACMMYAEDSGNDFPSGLEILLKKEYLSDAKVLIAAHDRTSVLFGGKGFTEKNTTYAYLGKGLNLAKVKKLSVTPLAFEKPWLAETDKIAVLYADGHAEVRGLPDRKTTCKGLAEVLLKEVSSPEKEILLKNAAKVDALNGRGK